MNADRRCPLCATPGRTSFLRLEAVPVNQNLLMTTYEAARGCERGDLDIAFCDTCGFIANLAFDPARLRYTPDYENAQSFSPSFRRYLADVASQLVSRHDIRGKRVVEIGCGNGDFLRLICALSGGEGIGFDPSFDAARTRMPASITVIPDVYRELYAGYSGDLFCFRHTLEHVADPVGFLRQVRQTLGKSGAPVYCEVPDIRWILEQRAFWDFFYEHCNYFSSASLARLFAATGFEVLRTGTAFGDQYLWLEALPVQRCRSHPDDQTAVAALGEAVRRFTSDCARRVGEVREEIEALCRAGQRCVVWGAGAKGVTLLNTLALGLEAVEFVVDINPRKQGRFIPGTGQQIVAPDFLTTYKPDVVLVMNRNYLHEIGGELDEFNLSPRLAVF